MILVIVQYSLIAIAKILLLNGRFDSYAKMYFVRVALHTSLDKILTGVLTTQFMQCM